MIKTKVDCEFFKRGEEWDYDDGCIEVDMCYHPDTHHSWYCNLAKNTGRKYCNLIKNYVEVEYE